MRKNSQLSALASVLATGPLGFLDVSSLTRHASFLALVKNRAGTNPTLDVKLQSAGVPAAGYSFGTAGSSDNKLKAGASTTVLLGAKFTQSGARSISSIQLMLNKIGTLAAGKKVTVAIHADDGGSPAATALGSTTIDIDTQIATTYAWVTATLGTEIDLADATVYHIVLSADYTASATNCVQWRNATVASAGNFETQDGTTWAAVTATKSFEVLVSQRTYTDITGGAFTQVTGALGSLRQNKEFSIENLQAATVRGYATIGGTSNPDFFVALEVNVENDRS